jgi:hypothetical protein
MNYKYIYGILTGYFSLFILTYKMTVNAEAGKALREGLADSKSLLAISETGCTYRRRPVFEGERYGFTYRDVSCEPYVNGRRHSGYSKDHRRRPPKTVAQTRLCGGELSGKTGR